MSCFPSFLLLVQLKKGVVERLGRPPAKVNPPDPSCNSDGLSEVTGRIYPSLHTDLSCGLLVPVVRPSVKWSSLSMSSFQGGGKGKHLVNENLSFLSAGGRITRAWFCEFVLFTN